MIWTVLFAWLHFLAVGLTAGLLLAQYWMLRRPIDRYQAKLLGFVDLGYLLSLIGALATGLGLVFYFGTGAALYAANALFWTKMGLLAAIAAVSVVPTLQYVRWSREARTAPAFAPLTRDLERVQACVSLQLALMGLLPLFAALVARGYGL